MLITNTSDYARLCDRIWELGADETIGIDTETTGVALWTADVLRGVCIAFRGESYYIPVSHPDSWNVPQTTHLRNALERTAAMPVYANAPFDFRSLEAGIGLGPPMERYRDVQVISWLVDENRLKALKKLGAHFFGEDAAAEQKALKEMMKPETMAAAYKRGRAAGLSVADAKLVEPIPGKSWATFTAEDIADYAAQDADLTVRVHEALLAHREYAAIEPAVQKTHDVQAAAYRMIRRGVGIDVDQAAGLKGRAAFQASAIAADFAVNIASAPQLATLIYETWGLPVTDLTDSGKPSTAAATLEAMAGEHPGLDSILEYRRLTKATQFYETLIEHADAEGRVHTGFSVVGTVTGRWSSREPNLQQIPRASTNSDAKGLFVPSPGYELIGYDLAAAELRIAASLSGDEGMIAALSEPGRSMHKETALAVFGSDQDPFYTLGKALNFSIPYGVGPKKFAAMMAKGLKQKQTSAHYRQARAAIDAHRAAWPALHQAINNCSQYADLTGRLPLGWPGRFRHFTSDSMQWPVPSYQAFNSLVQSSVAHFVNDVLLALEPVAAELGAVPVLAVHDALNFECPPDARAELGRRLQEVTNDLNPWRLPMLWDAKDGL